MAPKTKGENTKKVAGNAKKAEAAAQKQAVADNQKAKEEEKEWSKGAKGASAKKEAEADKKADAARKKAEREALLAEEEKDQPIKPKGAGAKKAEKKTLQAPSKGTLDLSALDDDDSTSNKPSTALNATGIDNALDALSLTNHDNSAKVDRHPERRFKAAYAAFEARRLPEVEVERPGLRKNQRVEIVRKEFERSDENPFNQVNAKFDSTRDEVREIREKERGKVEGRLGGS